jgi:hypothetical protein
MLSSRALYADNLQFGVVGSPIDLSANVTETILPGGVKVFQDSKPLFGTGPDPKQSAELLHHSNTGVNPSPRSKISDAFASSLAESNGNGGVGVSQLILGSPGMSGENITRQMAAQSLWTHLSLQWHSHCRPEVAPPDPGASSGIGGIPPFRDNPSFTETAQASARVDTVITHADGTFTHGGSFEFGLWEFETQIPDPLGDFENFADMELIGSNGSLFTSLHEDFDFPQDRATPWPMCTR